MNIAPQIESETMQAAPGERITLDHDGVVVESGRVELFLVAQRDGKPVSQRHFLCEVKAGGLLMPLPSQPDGFSVAFIAVEASTLRPMSLRALTDIAAAPDLRARLAGQIDQWIGGLSHAVGAATRMPSSQAVAIVAGEEIDYEDGAVVTARSGVAWIAHGDLIYSGLKPPPSVVVPVATGAWVTLAGAGKLRPASTEELLATEGWFQALCDFHDLVVAVVGEELKERHARIDRISDERRDSSARLAERVVDSFHHVAKAERVSWRGKAGESEQVLAAFMIVADAIGLDLPQRAREQIRKAETVDEAIRSARLRQRQVALRGTWWREDLGPLIGFLDEERRPVALLPTGTGRWELFDPAEGRAVPLTERLAERVAPTAHMLYATFADKPLSFKEFVTFGLPRSHRDLTLAVLTALAGAALSLATPMAMRLAFDRFIPAHQGVQLVELAVGLFLAAVIAALFRLAYDHAALRLDGRAAGNFPPALMDRILRLPDHAIRFGSADLALRFGSAESVRKQVYTICLTSVPAVFLCVCNGTLMFWYAPAAAGVAVAGFVILCGLSALFAWLQRDAQRKGEQLNSDIFNIVFQLVQAVTVVRAAAAEARAFAHWGIDFAELRKRSHKARRISTVFETILALVEVLSLAGVFLLLAILPGDKLSTGAFVAFVWAYGAFYGNSIQLVRNVGAWVGLDASWDRASPLLRAVPERSLLRRDPGPISGAFEATNVAFRYGNEGAPALAGVSIEAKSGEFIAIVGASGSGKSTLMRLLLGLDQPLQGTVQFDGQDLRHLDPELVRRQIGVVLQNGKLFPGTLFENIMGSFNGNMDDAWEAARQAGMEEEIKALPMGMHTVVTEASAAFSGGQVQRLIIARALVGKPRILLFDEATSSLDNITQAIVTRSLSRLAVTRVVIAHRLSTVRQADRIYVLDKGRVAQSGRYDELVKAQGPFAEFARRQLA